MQIIAYRPEAPSAIRRDLFDAGFFYVRRPHLRHTEKRRRASACVVYCAA